MDKQERMNVLYLKDKQFLHLQEIIKTLTGVDVQKDKSRIQHIVNAKMIYAIILRDAGYGCSVISRSMVMHHATILHYFKSFDGYVKSDVQFRNSYERIKSEFNREYDPIYYLSEVELKKELISLRIKNELVSSELELCKKNLSEQGKRSKKFDDIFKCIEQRTRPGTEDRVLLKINQMYNGIYSHRN